MTAVAAAAAEAAGGASRSQLWDLASGEVLLQLFQKAFSRDAWPAIQLSPEEDLAFVSGPNAVNVYCPRDFPAGNPSTPPRARLGDVHI